MAKSASSTQHLLCSTHPVMSVASMGCDGNSSDPLHSGEMKDRNLTVHLSMQTWRLH
ncbi:hypothetical protein JVT61DRAFT_3647 [Boletus reticuloceps]|uniref:Uncharacterized protein n=1 Tax=Boletus reticuloceps TaxID=495285 RepID=A0A8I3A9A7_9AGAM|nr:hypothetical protein JVT61DRAFT_3647 [Boletus reticuloceps]